VAASEVPAGFNLTALNGDTRPVEEWTITFQLLVVVLDPYTYESSWLLGTAGRILETFRGASVRIGFVVTADETDTRRFLGPWADEMMVFVDGDRSFVKACELSELPALCHVRQTRQLLVAEGWQPPEWKAIVNGVAIERHWTQPLVPGPGDPAPYVGSPAT